MDTTHLLISIWLIPTSVFSGYPLSDPYDGSKNTPYNLIDTNPQCFWEGTCPFFPGGAISTFPNSEERFQHILHNMHRMFPNNSLATPLGSRMLNTLGDDTSFPYGTYCGTANVKPQWWYSTANQMARFKQWDETTCNQSWYHQPDITPHSTCGWGSAGNISFHNTTVNIPANRCDLFNGCTFENRGDVYCDNETRAVDQCWFHSEDICAGNWCIGQSAHCDPIFAPRNAYVGKGFLEGMGSACSVWNRGGTEISYQLPIAAHFDARVKMHSDDLPADGKYFGLMLEYFDGDNMETPEACYALYDGAINEMPVFISNSNDHSLDTVDNNYRKGQSTNYPELDGLWNPAAGFYGIDSYSVLFLQYFDPPELTCEPYAFVCKTSLNKTIRLPEDDHYYFGTEWIDWSYSDYAQNQNLNCKENHYYNHSSEGWTVNGGPTLTKDDIWYYEVPISDPCVGCSKIDVLDCLSQCFFEDVRDAPTQTCQANCHSASPTAPTSMKTANPAPSPTANPAQSPSDNPAPIPLHLLPPIQLHLLPPIQLYLLPPIQLLLIPPIQLNHQAIIPLHFLPPIPFHLIIQQRVQRIVRRIQIWKMQIAPTMDVKMELF
eukprot:278198_1